MDLATLVWCVDHLGSPPVAELFRAGHLSAVTGMRLADGQEVVVKVRPHSPRLAACHAAHRRAFAEGLPVAEPLTGIIDLDGRAASAERHRPGGTPLPRSGRAPGPFVELFAKLMWRASPAEVAGLRPPLPWVGWDHDEGGLWPRPDDCGADLDSMDDLPWADAAGRQARTALASMDAPMVVTHGDLYAGNMRWDGDRLVAVDDWDGVIATTEAAAVGVTAAIFPTVRAGTESSVAETEAFLASHEQLRGRPFTDDERSWAWAAGLWLRAFDAKKQRAKDEPVRSLTEDEAAERLRRMRGGS